MKLKPKMTLQQEQNHSKVYNLAAIYPDNPQPSYRNLPRQNFLIRTNRNSTLSMKSKNGVKLKLVKKPLHKKLLGIGIIFDNGYPSFKGLVSFRLGGGLQNSFTKFSSLKFY